MKRSFLRAHGKAGLELIEEAFVLLRTCPLAILAIYYLGSVPFAAGFLIFCSDLSRHPDAPDHLGSATLGIAGLFIWMKFFQAQFGRMLLAHIRGEAHFAWHPGEVFRTIFLQTIYHSSALFILPVAMLVVLPMGWVYAFYQNITALDDGKTRLRGLFQSATQQSSLWPAQNHVILLTLSGFGFFVFLNWVTLGFFVPQMLKMLFGIESVFTLSPWSMLNTTFFAVTAALTYLVADPLIKACYVLRCFYGRSLQSGDDLRTEVRRLSTRAVTLLACLLLSLSATSLHASENASAPPPPVESAKLDKSISTVIQQGKYTWRTPTQKVIEKKEGILDSFFKSIKKTLTEALASIGKLLKKIQEWLSHRDRSSPQAESNPGWVTPQISLLFIILAVVASGFVIAAMRIARHRRRTDSVLGTALVTIPDLEDENIVANDLPEDDWTKMGRRFLDQGELRLALRAFYLASLAHLASRSLITIARSKSNRDYEGEVRRRGHALPGLPAIFGENVTIFDRVWYGLHEVNPELVQRFIANLEKMKSVA